MTGPEQGVCDGRHTAVRPVRRRDVLAIGAAAMAAPSLAWAQPRASRLVAAMIGAPNPLDETGVAWSEAIRAGLRGQGWNDGDNVQLEVRPTAGARVLTERYAAELLALRPDIFITGTTENAVAIHQLTQSVPLVFVAVPDPIAAGLIDTYPRPGGNATGVTHLEPSIAGKMVDMLVAIAPSISRVVFFTNPASSQAPAMWRPFAIEAAGVHGLSFEEAYVSAIGEVAPAIDAIAAVPGAGLLLPSNNWVHNNASFFIDAIDQHRLPAVYPSIRMVEAGALICIGVDIVDMFRLGGDYAGRILNGAAPRDLPVQGAPFRMAVNLRTAAAHGITIPLSVLAIADQVIE
jgi:putative tryptophan/tyrosine transport system substrate-binding protein